MTDTDTAGTALAQVAPGALALVAGSKPWTVAKLADLLVTQERPGLAETEPLPPPAPEVTVTPELLAALRALPKVFGGVNVPQRRVLTDDEIKALTTEAIAINRVVEPLGTRKEAISEIMRHHQDAAAETTGLAVPHAVTRGGKLVREATPRIAEGKAKGHYLLASPGNPHNTPVPGYQDSWQQRYTKGKAEPDVGALLALYESGRISREEYLSFTAQVRVLDEEKIAAQVRRNPSRALEILAAITVKAAPGASLYAPKK